MKTISKALMFAAVAMAASCAKEINPDVVTPEVELVPMEFVSSIETKTQLASDGLNVQWIAGDEITVFDGTNTEVKTENEEEVTYDKGRKFVAQSAGPATSFTGEAAVSATEYYAVYPYSSSARMNATSKLMTASLPAQQTAVAGSFADDLSVLVAKADGNTLNFKNVCSLVKFTLAEAGVKSITLIGNNNEVLSGSFTIDWNNGDPAVAVTKPSMTVTLRDAADADLAAGTYYFTILPVNFTNGFSIVLGMNDGTQKIKKGTKGIDVKRNKILSVPAVSAYEPYSSNFVKYNDNFELTYSGKTIKRENNGYATYVTDYADPKAETEIINTLISADGIYFVNPNSTTAQLNYNSCSKLVIAGDDSSVRVPFEITKILQPVTDETGFVILADLNIKNAKARIFEQATASPFEKFGSVILNDCKIQIKEFLAHFNEKAMTLADFIMEDCDYLMYNSKNGNSYVLNTNNKESTFGNIVFKNNIFQNVEETSSVTNFRFLNGYNKTGAAVENITVEHNTLVKCLISKNGFIYCASLTGDCQVHDNIYVESHLADTAVPIVNAASYGDEMTYNITHNYYWISDSVTKEPKAGNNLPEAIDGSELVRASGRPRLLNKYPLSTSWEPENGLFGYEEDLQYYDKVDDPAPTDAIPLGCGAQRGTTTSAGADAAAYSYSSVNMGNL